MVALFKRNKARCHPERSPTGEFATQIVEGSPWIEKQFYHFTGDPSTHALRFALKCTAQDDSFFIYY